MIESDPILKIWGRLRSLNRGAFLKAKIPNLAVVWVLPKIDGGVMQKRWVNYKQGEKEFRGFLVYEEEGTQKPAVIVAHAWKGQDDFAREKAADFAKRGYIGFAADLYGEGKCVETNDEAAKVMTPLFINRKLLRDRIVAAYERISSEEVADPNQIGAVGFCFGGLTVLELLRSGVKLQGVVSVHGLLGDTLGEKKAEIEPSAESLHGSLLLLHGYQDPLVSQQDIALRQREFTEKGIDWQMHIYGEAMHAFTNPLANDKESGLMYNPRTEKRALEAMQNFLSSLFQA